MKPSTSQKSEDYQRFEALTEKLVSVPKAEIDAEAKKLKRKKARTGTRRRSATATN
jgi:hypothetical protein